MSKETIQDNWPHEGTFCWGCGINNTHGLHLQSYWDDDIAVATWTPKEHHLAFPGILNGGIIATLIDCHATGTSNAAALKINKDPSDRHFMYVTGSLSVKFLRPTPLDKPVVLQAQASEIKGSRITVTVSLFSGDDKCATGEVVTVRVEQEVFLNQF
ncbi:MAG: PaaI family thioesterase [Candidatus Thorarchaeota archaeon]